MVVVEFVPVSLGMVYFPEQVEVAEQVEVQEQAEVQEQVEV